MIEVLETVQVGILRMFEQFALFQQYQGRLSAEVGAAQAQRVVNGALVLMTLGGNDFVNNYFLTPVSARSRQFTIPQYCRYLISEYRKILMVYALSTFFFSFTFFLSAIFSYCINWTAPVHAMAIITAWVLGESKKYIE